MAYRFNKNESLPHAIRRVFTEEINWAVGQLADSKKRGEAVHEARKSIKKLRALLTLIAKPLGARYKVEDRYLRYAGQSLSQLRDSAVILETFDAIAAKHHELDAIAMADIRNNLVRGQREAVPEKQVLVKVLQSLADAGAKAAAWPLDHLEFAALSPDLVAAYRSGRKALKRALKLQTAESFHAFRKQVKKHWYHLRLFEGSLNAEMKKRVKDLRALETVLGNEHDLTVLCQRIAADVETSRDRQQVRQFVALLQDEAMHLRHRALESGQQLYSNKPRAFAQMLSGLWAAIPKRPAAAAPFRKAAVA